MKVTTTHSEKNHLLDRVEAKFSIEHQGESTPSSEEVKSRLAAELSVKEEEVDIKSIRTKYGTNTSIVKTLIKADVEIEETQENNENEEDEDNSSQDKDEHSQSYDEIVNGTISDAKAEISELENPNYEDILEAEENGKDRKTFKQWIEERIEKQ